MSARQNVLDARGYTMGYIMDDGVCIWAQSASGRSLGYYNKQSKTTCKPGGSRYAQGDMTSALIMEDYLKNK